MGKYHKYFTLSYDDGVEQDKTVIALMKKYGIKGTFNLNSNLFGVHQHLEYYGTQSYKMLPHDVNKDGWLFKTVDHQRIHEDEIKEVFAGMEIASHGANHRPEAQLTDRDEMYKEYVVDREILQKYSDLPVVGHVYPFGIRADFVANYLKDNGFRYVREVYPQDVRFHFPSDNYTLRPTCLQLDRKMMKYAKQFIDMEATEEDLLFMVWGHCYEIDFKLNFNVYDRLEELFKMISEHDDIICCTNAEALDAYAKNL